MFFHPTEVYFLSHQIFRRDIKYYLIIKLIRLKYEIDLLNLIKYIFNIYKWYLNIWRDKLDFSEGTKHPLSQTVL
jgi:hypothetical protein